MPKLAVSIEENTESAGKAQLRAHSRWHWGLRIFSYDFLYLFLAVLALRCCKGFSLIAVTSGYSGDSALASGASCKMPGWINHKLESRLSGEIPL